MSLPEDIRQEYLQALGIENYFPRFKLPAAPESTACIWPQAWLDRSATPADSSVAELASIGKRPEQIEPEQIEKQASEPDQENGAEKVSIEQGVVTLGRPTKPDQHSERGSSPLRKVVSEETSLAGTQVNNPAAVLQDKAADRTASSAVARSATPSTSNQTAKSEPQEIRLQLLCIRVNDNLAILNAMPHFGPKNLSVQHKKLLQNFLGAHGINMDRLHIEETPFHWPLVQGLHVDNSKGAAALALIAYLQQKLSDWQYSKLLVMGEQVVTRLFTPEEEESQGQENSGDSGDSGDSKVSNEKVNNEKHLLPTLEKQSWDTFYTRSLDEILQSPMLKKEAWTVLKKLKD